MWWLWAGCAALRPPAPELSTEARLEQVVREWGPDPDSPWSVKHAWVGLGQPVILPDGRDSVDAVFADFADLSEHGVVFPAQATDADGRVVLIEPHTDLILKGLVQTRVARDREVEIDGTTLTVDRVLAASLAEFGVDAAGAPLGRTWSDMPWTLAAVAAWGPEQWTAGGRSQSMSEVERAFVADLLSSTSFLEAALVGGERPKKQRQGIYAYPCGGFHQLEALGALAAARPDGAAAALISRQATLLLFRLDLELGELDALLQSHPEHRSLLLAQRLRFLGHWLEALGEFRAAGGWTPGPEEQRAVARALRELDATVRALEADGAFLQMKAWKNSSDHQRYLDLLGDSAHALHGVRLWR